jgi:hypothetical protein
MVFIEANPKSLISVAKAGPYISHVIESVLRYYWTFFMLDLDFLPVTVNRNDLVNFDSAYRGLVSPAVFLVFAALHTVMASVEYKNAMVRMFP